MADEPIKILTDRDVIAAIPQLIKEADEFFTLVSPFTSFRGSWLSDIKRATRRGIAVCVVYNPHEPSEDNPRNQDLDLLPERVELHQVDFLHAKIYLTDKSVIITSMNYTSWSNRNREIAVRFDRETAQKSYDEVRTYVDELLDKIPDSTPVENPPRVNVNQGYCIQCGEANTPYSFEKPKPLCREHWDEWRRISIEARYSSKYYYCYRCGKKREVTFTNPVCKECE